jgi:hypothetical protein
MAYDLGQLYADFSLLFLLALELSELFFEVRFDDVAFWYLFLVVVQQLFGYELVDAVIAGACVNADILRVFPGPSAVLFADGVSAKLAAILRKKAYQLIRSVLKKPNFFMQTWQLSCFLKLSFGHSCVNILLISRG